MDSDILAKLLGNDPDNEVLFAMLADALAEEREVDPEAGRELAVTIRESARSARELVMAVAELNDEGGYRERLRRAIGRTAPQGEPPQWSYMVVPGSADPNWTANFRAGTGSWWNEWTVTVSAGWVLQAVAYLRRADRAEKGRRRARRDRGARD